MKKSEAKGPPETFLLRHEIKTQIGIISFVVGKSGADEVFVDVSNDDMLFEEGASLIVQVEFNAKYLAGSECTFDSEAEFETGGGNVHDPHDALVQFAVVHAIIVDARQIGGLAVLPTLLQGNFEPVTAIARAIDRDFFVDRGILGHIGSGDIAALGAYKGGGVVVGDEDFFNHFHGLCAATSLLQTTAGMAGAAHCESRPSTRMIRGR